MQEASGGVSRMHSLMLGVFMPMYPATAVGVSVPPTRSMRMKRKSFQSTRARSQTWSIRPTNTLHHWRDGKGSSDILPTHC